MMVDTHEDPGRDSPQDIPLPNSPVFQPYRYERLPTPTSIRLLKVEGEDADGVLQCSLQVVDLNDQPAYHCLSYCWDNPHARGTYFEEHFQEVNDRYSRDFPWRIRCDDGSLYVRGNLHEALSELPRNAWSDHVNKRDVKNQRTLLHRAVIQGSEALISKCISSGVDLNVGDRFGKTALHYAAQQGDIGAVKELAESGSDLRQADNNGKIPLDYARQFNHGTVLAYLKEKSKDQEPVTPGRRAPSANPDNLIWVDAICINQSDLAERDSQVAIMDLIFLNASYTVAWLGAEDEYTALATQTIKELASAPGKISDSEIFPYRAHYDSEELKESYENAGVPFVSIEAWGALAALFLRQWYQRLWVCQEVVLTDYLIIFCGKYEILWEDFTKVARDLYERSQILGRPASSYFIPLDQPEVGIEHSLVLLAKWRDTRRDIIARTPTSERLDLGRLIEDTRTFLTSDPKDKIYGLYGIYHWYSGNEERIRPDYSAPVEKCYADITKLIIRESRELRILHTVVDPSARNISYPSWTPDFSVPYSNIMTAMFAAGRDFSPRLEESSSWEKLAIPASHFDTVSQVATERARAGAFLTLNPSWFELTAALGPRYFTGESRTEVLWRTLCANQNATATEYPAPSEWGELFRVMVCAMVCDAVKEDFKHFDEPEKGMGWFFLASLEWARQTWDSMTTDICTPEQVIGDIGHPDGIMRRATHQRLRHTIFKLHCLNQCEEKSCTPTLDEIKEFGANMGKNPLNIDKSDFVQSYKRRNGKRRLFYTDKGLLGLGPVSLAVGDTIWIVPSMGGPAILREIEKSDVQESAGQRREFRFIGEAYVHGIMRGEAVHDGNRKMETIELV